MEIRLGKIYDKFPTDNIKVEFLDEITQEQFDKFEFSISQIEELNNIRRLLDFVVINEKEVLDFLNQSLQSLTSMSTSWNSLTREDYSNVYLNTNRLLLNYLSSVKTFVDHLETFFNRKFGKESNEYLEFKKLLSLFYDNSFAYRFFYQLRNYTQHVGLPIHNINFKTDFDRENKSVKGTLKISFNRDKLLTDFKEWKKVKADLENQQAEFDLTPLLYEMTHNIMEIERNLELILKSGLLKSVEYIDKLIGHLRNDSGEVFVAYNIRTKENGEIANYESIMIPFDTIDFIQDDFKISV